MATKQPDDLAAWAAALADAVTPDELRSLIREQERIGRDPNVPNDDQKLARQKARALRKHLD